MKPKPVFSGRSVRRDIEKAHIDLLYFTRDRQTVRRFNERLGALRVILSYTPGIGSPRYADPDKRPGLRHVHMRPFKYLVFYVERKDRVEILRIIPATSDIPAHLKDIDSR